MKSKRAEEFIDDNSGWMTDGGLIPDVVDVATAYQAVELAEQDAEERYHDDLRHYQLMMNDTCSHMIDERDEEITRYRTELEESKKREALAHKVIDDQRKEMEEVKARAVEACCFACTQSGAGCDHRLRDDTYLCDILNNFIQKLNER